MWFWIIPLLILIVISGLSFLISNNFGVSVSITTFGILFTTIWLYVLLPLKEKRQWEFVEKEVRKQLREEVRSLSDIFTGYFEGGIISLSYEMSEGIDEEKLWENARCEKLKEFAEKEELKMSKMGKVILHKNDPKTLIRYRKDLSNIENKYFKFLKPKEVLSLIKIQKLLTYLINISNSAKINHSLLSFSKEHYEKSFLEYGLRLFQEINYFNKRILNLFGVEK